MQIVARSRIIFRLAVLSFCFLLGPSLIHGSEAGHRPQPTRNAERRATGGRTLASAGWPKFGFDNRNTGRSTNRGTDSNDLKWTFSTGDYTHDRAKSVDSSGVVYATSRDGKLYAINPGGTKKWEFEGGEWATSAPAIGDDGTIYVGIGSKLYAVNADGTKKWEFPAGDNVSSSPAIDGDGIIYFGSSDTKLYALHADGTKKWDFATGGYVVSSPAIAGDGTIYVGSWDGKLYAVNPDGTKKWDFPTADGVEASPSVGSDGTVYVGSLDDKFYAVNPDGSQKWVFQTGNNINGTASIADDGTVYVGSVDGKLYAINPNGSKKWELAMGGAVTSSVISDSDGIIYVGSHDAKIYALNPDSSQKWVFETGGGGVTLYPTIGPNGLVYIGANTNIYAIGRETTGPVTLIVENTNDSGTDSLRDCLLRVRAGDTIKFSETVFNPANPIAQVKISLASELPAMDKGNVTIDARDRFVVIDGNNLASLQHGLQITSSDNRVVGLTINQFAHAGILITNGATDNVIGGDRSTGNGPNGQGLRIGGIGDVGIKISGSGTSGNKVKGCWIGLDGQGTGPDANDSGIVIADGANDNTIGSTTPGERNFISGNREDGITIYGTGTDNNVLVGNVIGLGVSATPSSTRLTQRMSYIPLGNGFSGVFLSQGTQGNHVGTGQQAAKNRIAHNGELAGSGDGGHGVTNRDAETKRNSVQTNSIYKNKNGAISLISGANGGVVAPTYVAHERQGTTDSGLADGTVSGTSTAGAGSIVEVYNDEEGQGEYYVGQCTVQADGTWECSGGFSNLNVTATVTTPDSNTSEFANYGKLFPDAGDPVEEEPVAETNPFTVSKLMLKVNFNPKALGKDKIMLKASLPLPQDLDPTGQNLTIDVGGASTSFTLDPKGRAKNDVGMCKLKYHKKTETWLFIGKVKVGNFASEWADEGMTDETVKDKQITMDVEVTVDVTPYSASTQLMYKAKEGKKGTAK